MDLIDRQAVIEVIDSVFPVDPMKSEYTKGIACGAALAKTYVKQLPSAQPEIIRCKDCKWFGDFGCAIRIVDDTDKPHENNYCSFAERRTDG